MDDGRLWSTDFQKQAIQIAACMTSRDFEAYLRPIISLVVADRTGRHSAAGSAFVHPARPPVYYASGYRSLIGTAIQERNLDSQQLVDAGFGAHLRTHRTAPFAQGSVTKSALGNGLAA